MKRKTKTQKGITLIALIITIIVLLILAVVTIRAVQGDGIIAHAKNARNQYEQKAAEENALLLNLAGYITGQGGGNGGENGEETPPVAQEAWTQNKTEVKNVKTNQTLEVGDIITNYSETGYTGQWCVLGVENGKLLLTTTANATELKLEGIQGYNAGLEQLTTICENYGKGTGSVGAARSIKIEDINRVTGYNLETAKPETKFVGEIGEYRKKVTFQLQDGKIMYSEAGGDMKDSTREYFIHPDGRVITVKTDEELKNKMEELGITNYNKVNSIDIENRTYQYNTSTLRTDAKEPYEGVNIKSKAYKTLFEQAMYWIASTHNRVNEENNEVIFGIQAIVLGMIYNHDTWHSYGWGNHGQMGVRPVVTLNSDFTPTVDTPTE